MQEELKAVDKKDVESRNQTMESSLVMRVEESVTVGSQGKMVDVVSTAEIRKASEMSRMS